MSNDQKVALAQAFLGSDNSIDQATINPTDLAMTLNYFDRLYNFTIGSVNVRDLILRDRRKIDSTATAADLLAAIQSQANQTRNQLLSGNNSATFFNQKLAHSWIPKIYQPRLKRGLTNLIPNIKGNIISGLLIPLRVWWLILPQSNH